jgi:chromosome segregation ATPase
VSSEELKKLQVEVDLANSQIQALKLNLTTLSEENERLKREIEMKITQELYDKVMADLGEMNMKYNQVVETVNKTTEDLMKERATIEGLKKDKDGLQARIGELEKEKVETEANLNEKLVIINEYTTILQKHTEESSQLAETMIEMKKEVSLYCRCHSCFVD